MAFKILLISGSVREPSYTRSLIEHIENVLEKHGATTTHWNLKERPLPIADPEFHHTPEKHTDPVVREFVKLADDADAFVLASPVYHNSYSGVLKNALDHIAIPQFTYKPVGLASHGGHRNTQVVDHLRIVVRGLRGIGTPTNICTADEDYVENGSCYELKSDRTKERIDLFVRELLYMTRALKDMRNGVEEV